MNPYDNNPFTNNEPRDLRNEYDANRGLRGLDFDHCDSIDEFPAEWAIESDLSNEELARIDSDAEIADYRMNGYE